MRYKPEPRFATEAALCAAFLGWASGFDGVRCYSEWAGWDILVVYRGGYQLGIQAKLRLNAEVIGQAAPDAYGWEFDHARPGPDFRAVLVPDLSTLGGIASRLGLVVFSHRVVGYPHERVVFRPSLDDWRVRGDEYAWTDWNPSKRHKLPATPTDSIAGSPCPVTLTPWKLGAIDVLAELAAKGTITTKRMKDLGVNPSRWLTGRWLLPGDKRGLWVRGDRCPRFEEQHPTAFAVALEKARAAIEESA